MGSAGNYYHGHSKAKYQKVKLVEIMNYVAIKHERRLRYRSVLKSSRNVLAIYKITSKLL